VASHALGLADLGLDSLEAVLGAALAMAGLLPLPLLQPLYQYVLYLHCSVVHTTNIIHNLLLVISLYLYYIYFYFILLIVSTCKKKKVVEVKVPL
jgi:hypothetical protein